MRNPSVPEWFYKYKYISGRSRCSLLPHPENPLNQARRFVLFEIQNQGNFWHLAARCRTSIKSVSFCHSILRNCKMKLNQIPARSLSCLIMHNYHIELYCLIFLLLSSPCELLPCSERQRSGVSNTPSAATFARSLNSLRVVVVVIASQLQHEWGWFHSKLVAQIYTY